MKSKIYDMIDRGQTCVEVDERIACSLSAIAMMFAHIIELDEQYEEEDGDRWDKEPWADDE